MATQYQLGEDGKSLPEGIVLAHTLYGEPAVGVTHAHTAATAGVAVIPVGDDGIGWYGDEPRPASPEPAPVEQPTVSEPETAPVVQSVAPTALTDRAKRCFAKGDTCMGWRIKDSEFCAAHAGVLRRQHRDTE